MFRRIIAFLFNFCGSAGMLVFLWKVSGLNIQMIYWQDIVGVMLTIIATGFAVDELCRRVKLPLLSIPALVCAMSAIFGVWGGDIHWFRKILGTIGIAFPTFVIIAWYLATIYEDDLEVKNPYPSKIFSSPIARRT